VPKLTRAGAGDEAVAHASASISAPRQANYLLSKVFPGQYHDNAAMAKTGEVMVKDNILAGYDDFMTKAGKADTKATQLDARIKTLKQQAKALVKSPPAGLSPQDVGKLRRANTMEIRKAIAERGQAKRESTIATKAANDVAGKHDLKQYDADVQAGLSDPTIAANVDRWKTHVNPYLDQLYNEIKGLDPNHPREGRGRHSEARVNLLAVDEKSGQVLNAFGEPIDPEAAKKMGDYSLSGNTRNPNARRDRFDRAASFTGNYSVDPQAMLTEALGRRWNEVTKLRLYDALQKKGIAVIPEDGKPPPRELGGQRTIAQGIKVPETDPATGKTRQVEKTMYVRQDVFRELRAVLNTDLRTPEHPVAKALTAVQLLSPIDVIAHSKNLLSVVSNAQGAGSAWKDVVRRRCRGSARSTLRSALEPSGARSPPTRRRFAARSPACRSRGSSAPTIPTPA
jgi:hypothetical protein